MPASAREAILSNYTRVSVRIRLGGRDADGQEHDLAKQTRRVVRTQRVRWAVGLPSGVGLRVVRYGMYCHSILCYWLTLLSPTEARRRAERRWAAIVFTAPMHAVPLEVFGPARLGGVGTVFPTVDTTHMAAVIGFLQRSQVVDDLTGWLDLAHSHGDVALRWMGTLPVESRALGHLLAVRRQLHGVPGLAEFSR